MHALTLALLCTSVTAKVTGFKKAMSSSFAAQLDLINSVAESLQDAPVATAITQCDRALTVLEELVRACSLPHVTHPTHALHTANDQIRVGHWLFQGADRPLGLRQPRCHPKPWSQHRSVR